MDNVQEKRKRRRRRKRKHWSTTLAVRGKGVGEGKEVRAKDGEDNMQMTGECVFCARSISSLKISQKRCVKSIG